MARTVKKIIAIIIPIAVVIFCVSYISYNQQQKIKELKEANGELYSKTNDLELSFSCIPFSEEELEIIDKNAALLCENNKFSESHAEGFARDFVTFYRLQYFDSPAIIDSDIYKHEIPNYYTGESSYSEYVHVTTQNNTEYWIGDDYSSFGSIYKDSFGGECVYAGFGDFVN